MNATKVNAKSNTLEELIGKDFAKVRKEISFEDGVELIQELIGKVESGELPLEQSVACYELGNNLITHLESLLGAAKEKIKLKKVN